MKKEEKKEQLWKFVGVSAEDIDSPVFGDTVEDVLVDFSNELDDQSNGYTVKIYEYKKTYKYDVPQARAKFVEVKGK